MPVKITWIDQSTKEDSHIILRKPYGSTEFTTLAEIPSQPSISSGTLEYIDMETLPAGEYTYAVMNIDTSSGMTGISEEFTITSIDPEKRELCIGMTQDAVDMTGVHYTTNNGTTVNTSISATEFDGASYIQTNEPLSLGDTYSISLNINPSSSRTSSGSLLECRYLSTTLLYKLELTVDGALVFKFRNASNSLLTFTTPTGVVLSDTWNHVHVTKDSSHILKFYINAELIYSVDIMTVGFNADMRNDIPDTVKIGEGYIGEMKHLSIVNDQVIRANSCVECIRFVPLELLPPDNIQVSVVYPEANFVSPPVDVSVSIQVPPDIEYLYPPRDVVASMIYS